MHAFILGVGFVAGVFASPKVRKMVQAIAPNFRNLFPWRTEADVSSTVAIPTKVTMERKSSTPVETTL